MRFVALHLEQRLGLPLLKGRQRQKSVGMGLACWTQFKPIGLQTKGHRRIKGIHRCEVFTRQPWPLKTAQTILPKLVQTFKVGQQGPAFLMQSHSNPYVHRTVVSKRPKSRVHFRGGRPPPSPRHRVSRPDTVMALSQKFNDGQGIPDRLMPVDQHRHLTRG